MKATDYVKIFSESKDRDKILAEIGRMFIAEIEMLAKARNAKYAHALIPIVKELEKKWMKFAEIVNKTYYPVTSLIKYDGFLLLIKHFNPELYKLWIDSYKK